MDELRDTQYNLPIGTDCISRRKLLDKFEPWLEVHDYNDGERNVIKAVLYEIKCMPPATDNNVATTDCISRQAAIELLSEYPFEKVVNCISILEEMPSAQPEIVRCKDCKYWIPYDWMFSEVWQSRNIADYPEDEIGCTCCDMSMKANDFCSRGEKREVTE